MRPLLLLLFLTLAPLSAQTLQGVLDIHCHSDPDSVPRSIDALALAKLAQQRGYRGIVLKNHYEPTASLAYLARQAAPNLEVFGGIALNRSVGGINTAAIERMTKVRGGWGRVVWMPTFDAENQVRVSKESRPFVSVSKNGELLPEVREALDMISRQHLVLATGHSSPAEVLLLIREAKVRGVEHIVVTHGMLPPVSMSVEQMKEAIKLGAYIEFVYNALIGPSKAFDMPEYAAAIRALGPAGVILSSDLGQAGNPLHPVGMLAFFAGLRQHGFQAAEIEQMAKTNPARLLGLLK